jgi:cation-transporting P-type ATPase 13A2
LLDILSEPLFVLQYLMFCIWTVQKLYLNILGNLSFCLLIVSINYIILYRNYAKIKQIAEKEFTVQVVRNGSFISISNHDLVPGDIYQVGKEIPCDSVLIEGDVLVNEANFTGENLPILKHKLDKIAQFDSPSHWVFEGSELLKAREGVLAMAVHTGYTTHKGRIIRKIVKQNVKEPDFTHKILIFFLLAYFSGALIYLACLSKLMSSSMTESVVIFLLFEIVSLAVPIGYIGVVNFFPGLSLIRLSYEGILGQ